MNEEIKENGSTKEEIENKDYVFSWRKLCAWLSLVLSVALPLAAIGLSLITLSNATEEEKDEVSVLCYISMGVGAFFVINDFVLQLLAL